MHGVTASTGPTTTNCTQGEPAVTEQIASHREFIALDLETTGLSARTDRIVEIGAIRFLENGDEVARYQSLVNPERPMPPSAYAIHGLSDEQLADARVAREVLPEFLEFLGNPGASVLLAHHASFDAGFLGWELSRAGMELPGHFLVDTLALARRRLPELRSHRLDFLTMHFGLDPEGSHRAVGDSRRVKEIWLRLGGPSESAEMQVSYPMLDAREPNSVPRGWEPLRGRRPSVVRSESSMRAGRGAEPRLVTPRNFVQRGGYNYMVAFCHLDSMEKSFRLDRIRRFDLVPPRVPRPLLLIGRYRAARIRPWTEHLFSRSDSWLLRSPSRSWPSFAGYARLTSRSGTLFRWERWRFTPVRACRGDGPGSCRSRHGPLGYPARLWHNRPFSS